MASIDWSRPAAAIKNQVRALDPWPRAFTHWRRGAGEPLRIILHRVQADRRASDPAAAPGTVVEAGPRLRRRRRRGRRRNPPAPARGKRAMAAGEFLRGYPLPVGAIAGHLAARSLTGRA